jgi:hypothetical protein
LPAPGKQEGQAGAQADAPAPPQSGEALFTVDQWQRSTPGRCSESALQLALCSGGTLTAFAHRDSFPTLWSMCEHSIQCYCEPAVLQDK